MNQEQRRRFLIEELLRERPSCRKEIPADADRQKILLRALMNVRQPGAISQRFLEVQDDYLQEELTAKKITRLSDLTPVREGIYLWRGDITTLDCGAIVNAANSGMTGCYQPCHNCIDNCIHTYAGIQLRLKCAEIMEQQGYEEPAGQAKITPAYNLPCEYVIHTVGPIVQGKLTIQHCELLKSCYRSCLELADKTMWPVLRSAVSRQAFLCSPMTGRRRLLCGQCRNTRRKPGIRSRWYTMFSKSRTKEYTGNCSVQIERLKQALETAETILIGAGAGLSASAGLTYSGERFERYFSDFHQKYGITDMYSGGFYPFDTLEEYWAWWSRHILYNRYVDAPIPVYQDLLTLVRDKDYFVLTTNVDHQFQRTGFDQRRLFYTQDTEVPGMRRTYDHEPALRRYLCAG